MLQTQIASPWPIIGHELAVARLARASRAGNVAHAYLFSGPDGVGKRTMARTLAQALLCQAPVASPCGECRACRLAHALHHPDLLVLDMAWQSLNVPQKSAAQSISVDAVRQMASDLARRPHEGPWKVLLVPHVDELTVAAANAFLKTLEEPPATVVILLTTRDPELLLPTIRSRCQLVPLAPLPVEKVEAALRDERGADPEVARLVARVSNGRIGWALRAVQDSALLNKRNQALATLQQVLAANRAERLLLAATLGKANDLTVIHTWATWWRDLLMWQQGAPSAITNVDQRALLESAAPRYTPEQVRLFLRELQRLLRLARETNVNPQLLWEVLLLKLPRPTD